MLTYRLRDRTTLSRLMLTHPGFYEKSSIYTRIRFHYPPYAERLKSRLHKQSPPARAKI